MAAKKAGSNGFQSNKGQRKVAVFEQDSETDDQSVHLLSEDEDDLDDSDINEDGEREDQATEDEDAGPRYAQFMDESDLEAASDDSDEEEQSLQNEEEDADSDEDSAGDVDEDALKEQMRNIPFGALVKAKSRLNDASDDEDQDSEPDISDLEPDEFAVDRSRLAAVKAGKQRSKGRIKEEELEAKRREVRERLRQLSGKTQGEPSTTSSSMEQDSWEEKRRQREQRHKEARARQELEKRAHKHAPTEMSSKRPVSRRRNVVETQASQVRDPRFESLSGSVNKDLFAKSYSFLPEMFQGELTTLKKTHSKLKKQEASQAGPKAKSEQALAIREERAKVEAALRRAEGLAGERERRQREQSVKSRIKQQNKERVEKGLQPYYPKQSEIREMLLKDKYDRLSGGAEDGKNATGAEKKQLKKALERRRKKNAQKEKKDMPVGIGFGSNGNAAVPKRKRDMGTGPSNEGGKRLRS